MKVCIEFLFKFHILKSGVNDWEQKEVHLILFPSDLLPHAAHLNKLHNPEGYVCVCWGGGEFFEPGNPKGGELKQF